MLTDWALSALSAFADVAETLSSGVLVRCGRSNRQQMAALPQQPRRLGRMLQEQRGKSPRLQSQMGSLRDL